MAFRSYGLDFPFWLKSDIFLLFTEHILSAWWMMPVTLKRMGQRRFLASIAFNISMLFEFSLRWLRP